MTGVTASTPAARVPPGPNVWVMAVLAWHGVLGVILIALGVMALLGVNLGDFVVWPGLVFRLLIGIACLALGGVQLLYWPGLRAYRSRARVLSLAINFAGLLLSLFVTFRQMTCINTCTATPNIFAPDRMATWLPFFGAALLFGLMAYGMWRRDVADLYGETGSLRTALTAYIYISPYLLTAAVFTVGLLIYAFILSFTSFSNENLYGGAPPVFVGLDNYTRAFTDDEFLTAISNVIWYAAVVVVFQTVISLALALMMNARFSGRRLFRTLFYAPSVTSSVVISLIFLWLFNGQGIVNYIVFEMLGLVEPLGNLGLRTPNTNWLNTPTRLGDLTYLKPFFDGSWHWLLAIPLFLAGIIALVRISLWLRDNVINRRAVLVAGVAALGAGIVLMVVLGAFPGAAPAEEGAATVVAIAGDTVIKTLLIALGLGIVAGLAVNFLEVEKDPGTAARSAALGTLAAVVLAVPPILLAAMLAAPETLTVTAGSHVTLYTLLVIPLLAGPLTAAATGNLSHRLFLPPEKDAVRALPPQAGGNMARRLDRWAAWMSSGLLATLAIWCVIVVLAAAATTGMQAVNQLGNEQFGALMLRGPSVAFMVVMLLNIFTTSPTFMIMFLAALQDIPGQLYEAAQIDGANRWQQFTHVTLPMLRPVMLLIVVLGTIGTFQIFDQVHVMTSGGPLNTTLTPVYLIFTKAIGDQRAVQMGYAAAMAFILGAIIFAITYIQRNYIERGTQQY